MSVELWPPIAANDVELAQDAARARELAWLMGKLHTTLKGLKTTLEETYALLAPVDPGSTLVVSTPRHEAVKGHVTRVGTRIVKGTIGLRLRTLPPCSLALNPNAPIHVAELATLNKLMTQALDLLSMCVGERLDAAQLSSQLGLLSEYMAEAVGLMKGCGGGGSGGGGGGGSSDTGSSSSGPDLRWTSDSVPPSCFDPALPENMSVHITIQDAALVLVLRVLEPADAPVNLGTKIALAIGTTRRLEHDEADRVFSFCPEGADDVSAAASVRDRACDGRGGGMGKGRGTEVQVFVREKVRVESADPRLMSLSAKLGALGHTLALARRNLSVVMDDGAED